MGAFVKYAREQTELFWAAVTSVRLAYVLIGCGEKIGIRGNSHFMVIENNSDPIAALVQKWIKKNVKCGSGRGYNYWCDRGSAV